MAFNSRARNFVDRGDSHDDRRAIALLHPIEGRRLGRAPHCFEFIVPDLAAAIALVKQRTALSVEHIYLGLPIGRQALELLFQALPALVSVDLLFASDDAVEAFAAVPNLEAVRLRRGHDALGLVDGLPELAALRSLEIVDWGPLAPGLVRRTPNLDQLLLERTSLASEDLRALSTLQGLRRLGLRESAVDRDVLLAVAACSGLDMLDIADNSLTPLAMAPLAALKHFSELDLSGNAVDLRDFIGLPLRHLHVASAGLTHRDLRCLASLEALIELDVTANHLDHAAGSLLAELRGLRALHANVNEFSTGQDT